MGLWVNTTYVNEGRVEEVADALTALCGEEGMAQIAPPSVRPRSRAEPMQYEPARFNDLWGCALFPGAPSWTVIQTAPLELLAERADGAVRMRLADLCRALSVPAFSFNVYDGTASILAEVSKAGSIAVCGLPPPSSSRDPLLWHGERIDETRLRARFGILPYPDLIAPGLHPERAADVIARYFGGANAGYCDNLVSVDTLIRHKPFDLPGGVVRYYGWTGPSRLRDALRSGGLR
jgi:hypothetical protein